MFNKPLSTSDWLCLWPGLRGLWVHGSYSSLLVALLFASLVQIVVLTSFVWPELIGASARAVVCLSVGSFWLVSGLVELSAVAAERRRLAGRADVEGLFRQAQREYLRGNWFQSEKVLKQLIDVNSHDVDARLILAGLYRRADRLELAEEQLEILAGSPRAAKWEWEIGRERQLVGRRRGELTEVENTAGSRSAEAA
jgi:hypothetical protein